VVTHNKIAEVQAGMDRAAVEALVGKPHSVMSIQGDDEPIETLIYNLDDKGTARVRLVNGKVASVLFE
jgi:precorrin-6B methylase 2